MQTESEYIRMIGWVRGRAKKRALSKAEGSRPSTTVENSLQISPFYAKQSQCQVRQNQHKHFYNNEIRLDGQLVIQTKQSQNKPN